MLYMKHYNKSAEHISLATTSSSMTDSLSAKSPASLSYSSSSMPPRRNSSFDEAAQLRHRPASRSSIPNHDVPVPDQGSGRRSSSFSDYSLKDARNVLQSSTDDLLLPKPSAVRQLPSQDSSPWHSAPLAFALLPAFGGMLFTNGSSITTDILLLGLAAIFLNWSVRLPWEWYHSAQSTRKIGKHARDSVIEGDEVENKFTFLSATLEEIPEVEPAKPTRKLMRPALPHDAAIVELHRHEMLALFSCFLLPMLGAYLLHIIRSQLSRPSEGLVSNYNLTIFLLASELRPLAHLVKIIQTRTLHLQRIVASDAQVNETAASDMKGLAQRLEALETRDNFAGTAAYGPKMTDKQSAALSMEVRKSLQPDLDALNRAVRRYEKRATMQAFQTESRLLELDSRLNDAISLAAAAANGHQKRGLTVIIMEWIATAIIIPVQAFSTLARLPLKTLMAAMNFGISTIPIGESQRSRKTTNGRLPGRSTDRLLGRLVNRANV